MTNVLVLQKYNNYFNRTIKKLSTVDDYRNADGTNYSDVSNINFNPADGVTTELILGKGVGAGSDENWYDESDYLIVYTSDGATPPVEVIVSRWFIVDAVRTRGGQHKLTLKRDVIADHLNSLLSCPAFIRKGRVEDDNPLILNDEGIGFNQIKTEETLLKDKTKSAWVVGYVAKDTFNLDGGGNKFTVQVPQDDFSDYLTIEDIASDIGISSSVLSNIFSGAAARYVNNATLKVWINYVDGSNIENYASSIRDGDLEAKSYQQGYTNHNPTTDCIAKLSYYTDSTGWHVNWNYNMKGTNAVGNIWTRAVNNHIDDIKAAWRTLTGFDFISNTMFDKLVNIANSEKPIYVNGVYKRLVITTSTADNVKYSTGCSTAPFSTVVTEFYNNYNTIETTARNQLYDLNLGGQFFAINCQGVNFTARLETLSDVNSIPAIQLEVSSTRNSCRDQVYDMFAIPFNDCVTDTGVGLSGVYAQALAQTIALQADAKVYDIQLLPYCPYPEMVNEDGEIIVSDTFNIGYDFDYIYSHGPFKRIHKIKDEDWTITSHDGIVTGTASWTAYTTLELIIMDPQSEGYFAEDTSHIDNVSVTYASRVVSISVDAPNADALYDAEISIFSIYEFREGVTGQGAVSICLYPKKAKFSINIDKQLSLKDSMKVEALCNKYRLCSPNYQGSFEFNVAKNGGTCAGFIADCTYKPYTPYIKVSPQFSWMYGGNYGDCRGLICGGDFSLGRINSAWESYELQNKNYQNIFNRDIQNLDINQDIASKQFYAGGILSSFNAGGQGAFTGAMIGGGWGALIGSVAAQSVSLTGLGIDAPMFEQGLHEQRQYAIDKFNYQLGNIKALPYTLTKVGAFDINSKIFPFLEYYTCTPTEKEALEMKLKYEGMTIGIVDTLNDYLIEGNGFVQADLIRNEAIKINSHELNEIYNELTKGVYV